MSPFKHKLKRPGEKYVSASETARLMEEGIISESKSNVRKLESDEDESDFECYDKSDGKSVPVDRQRTSRRQTNPRTTNKQIGRRQSQQ